MTADLDEAAVRRKGRLREVLARLDGLWLKRQDVMEIGLACGLTAWTVRALLEQDATEPVRTRARKELKKSGVLHYHRERVLILLGVPELLGSNHGKDSQHERNRDGA